MLLNTGNCTLDHRGLFTKFSCKVLVNQLNVAAFENGSACMVSYMVINFFPIIYNSMVLS